MSLSHRIAQIDLKWRLCFVVVVTAAYAVASRIIAHTSETFAEVELYRTPFRIVAAVLLWLVMRDILTRASTTPDVMKDRGFFAVVLLVLATPLLNGPYNVSVRDGVILAVASIPVGVFEEILHRGIIQTLCIMRWGVARGLAVGAVVFMLFHVSVTSPDLLNYGQIFLMGVILGLIYLKTGSLLAVMVIHAVHDALYSVPLFHYMQSVVWGLVALAAAATYAVCWFSGGQKALGRI